jgi:hypothetical protein
MIDAIKTLGYIDLEQMLGPKFDPVKDRCDGIPTRPSGAKAIEVGRQFRFPLWLQGLTNQRLPRPLVLGGNAHSTLHQYPNHLWNV